MDLGPIDTNVTKLPVRFRSPESPELTVVPKPYGGCQHTYLDGAQYVVDAALDAVECSKCHEKLNPMWVLKQITMHDRRFHDNHARYVEESKRLKERSRTKCDSCGKMTRISLSR